MLMRWEKQVGENGKLVVKKERRTLEVAYYPHAKLKWGNSILTTYEFKKSGIYLTCVNNTWASRKHPMTDCWHRAILPFTESNYNKYCKSDDSCDEDIALIDSKDFEALYRKTVKINSFTKAIDFLRASEEYIPDILKEIEFYYKNNI